MAHDTLTSKFSLEQITDQNFWKELNKEMHICNHQFMAENMSFNINDEQKNYLTTQMREEGYVQLGSPNWELPISRMAETVQFFAKNQIMPVFVFIYDEYWQLFYKLHHFYQTILNENYKMLPDFWCWYIDYTKDEHGWAPHRDKGTYSLFEDGSPKSLTTWIPLTNATTLNGCMYIVPKHLDKGGEKTSGKYGFELNSIRALPAPAGSILMWNQNVYHWGSRSSKAAAEPRISIAFEFQRGDIPPYNNFLLEPLINYSFNQRLILIGKQILQYTHMYKLAKEYEEIARKLIELKADA